MRVRIAVHRYRPEVGGTELMAEMMANSMASKGHDVEVVTLRTGPTLPDERLTVPPGDGAFSYRVRRLDFVGGPVRLPVGYWRVLREPTGVLHVFGNRIWNSDLFLPIARWLPYPKVLTGQNFYQLQMHPNFVNRLYAERYFPRAARNADCYVVQTVAEREQFRRFGFEGPIELIPHTVDVREFVPDPALGDRFRSDHHLEGELLLLSTGGYAPNKRMDRVIEGAARAKRRWRVVILGGDWPGHTADLEHCRSLAARLGVDVEFLGEGAPVPRPELLGAYQACDAYAQGSSYEGYGGAIQEAMTLGKPFVAFATGAVPEFAAAGAGYSVGSVTEFADRLDDLANGDDHRRQLGEAGRRDVLSHRSRDVTMDQYDRLFRRLSPGG